MTRSSKTSRIAAAFAVLALGLAGCADDGADTGTDSGSGSGSDSGSGSGSASE